MKLIKISKVDGKLYGYMSSNSISQLIVKSIVVNSGTTYFFIVLIHEEDLEIELGGFANENEAIISLHVLAYDINYQMRDF